MKNDLMDDDQKIGEIIEYTDLIETIFIVLQNDLPPEMEDDQL